MATGDEAGPSSAPAPAGGSSGAGTGSAQPPKQSLPDLEAVAARLVDDKLDMSARMGAAIEFKDLLEVYHNGNYPHYVKHMLPASLQALSTIPCSVQTDAPAQRTRIAILENMHRLPQLEVARAQAKDMMRAMMTVIREDNEENAVIAIKIVIDLNRHLKAELESEVSAFLSLVGDLYKNFKNTVAKAFESEASQLAATGKANATGDGVLEAPSPAAESQAASMAGSEAGLGGGNAPPKTLPKSFSSFKVLTECPIATVFILQTYKSNAQQAIAQFLPLTIQDCLQQQAQPQKEAHEAAKAKGEIFVGVAPGIKNRALYTEMVVAQVKTMSFLAYVLKGTQTTMRPFSHLVPGLAIRLLQDCPPEASTSRKELLVAIRHIFTTELRVNFVGQIDTLLDQRVLLGTGITTRETLRPLAISMLADLVHHIRNDLTWPQIVLTVHRHCQMLHDPTLAPSIMTMCCKLLLNLVDTIATRHAEGAPDLLRAIFDTLVEKLGGLPRLREDLESSRRQKLQQQQDDNKEPPIVDAVTIEKAKPVQANIMLPDYADALKDSRFLFRNILVGLKSLIIKLKNVSAPEPDSAIMGRLFVDGIKCWTLYDQADVMPDKEGMEIFTNTFIELEPQTFHEVFTTHMPFLFERMLASPMLLGIPQSLLSNENVSKRFVAILFRFLVDRLAELGDADKKHASVSLRLFKMAFMAVTIFPEVNEVVLQPHLSHLIMTSMKLASKASEPANYFLLLRALFRSIGGGRFELLYKDVLPLLPVLLENLNDLLNAAEPSRRELFVDLCLTVPVRLSVLLPYLGFLMRPLVLALQSSTDLVSQGLRTLELCIDNLTQEFLDPIMAPYAYDIMSALWKHLQPLPHNHQHSHTTMRILGKMGGRNRRLLQKAPRLEYHQPDPNARYPHGVHGQPLGANPIDQRQPTFAVHFDGSSKPQSMSLLPVTELALANVRRGPDAYHRLHAFELLRHAAVLFLDGTLSDSGRERDGNFERVVKGLFDATRVEDKELAEEATTFLKGFSRHVVALEAKRENTYLQFSQLTLAFFDGVVSALGAQENEPGDVEAIVELVRELVTHEFHQVCSAAKPELFAALIHSLASKHCNLCYDQLWQRKTGGWMGIDMLVRRCDLGRTWIRDHQLEIVRALLYMLKDMPTDPPRNVDAVAETLIFVLRTVNGPGETAAPQPSADEDASTSKEGKDDEASTKDGGKGKEGEEPPSTTKASDDKVVLERQFSFLVGVLLSELSSSNSHVRTTARRSFELLAELKGVGVTDILLPVKDRLLTPIFTKPLRALPFGMQIGHIDAITFCLELRPPLPDFNEELFRVLTEALALADADDQALIGRSTTSQYKNMIAVTQLRVVAIKLLASAMACSEFDSLGARLGQMRMRIISVYFKSLYSRSEVVIDTAYACLKETLQGQAKLPKDVLQSGLRPILMTLADAGRLTVPGLDGLARLLELLTSYFKVEIGTKLLAHMQQIAQPLVVERASRGGLDGPIYAEAHHLLQPRQPRESEPVETLAAIVRVFHLLPPAASNFMDQLVVQVCEIETMLKRTGPTPFTKPIAQYLDKNPKQAADLFFEHHLDDHRYVRMLRLVIGSDYSSNLRGHITEQRAQLLVPLFSGEMPAGDADAGENKTDEAGQIQSRSRKALSGLLIVRELERKEPGWLKENSDVVEALLHFWKSPLLKERRVAEAGPRENRASVQVVDLLCDYLTKEPGRADIYYAIVETFTHPSSVDLTPVVRFIYDHLAIKGTVELKRDVLRRFVDVFENSDASQQYKAECLRVLVNPILVATPRPSDDKSDKEAKRRDEKEADREGTVEEEEKKQEPLLDADLLGVIIKRIWKVFSLPKPPLHLCSDDLVRVELLHMSTMILEHGAQLLRDPSKSNDSDSPRKDAIKFGWANLKAEDVTVKNSAYIFIARFLDLFESPSKIVAQVYLGLLRSHQPEGRVMVRKALDILVPALPKRMPSEPGKAPDWAKATKRQLMQEGHNLPQLFGIMQLLVRHGDLFYPTRELFLPHIGSSVGKLGLSGTSNSETRLLAVDLVELVLGWEKKRMAAQQTEEEKKKKAKDAHVDGDGDTEMNDGAGEQSTGMTTRKRAGESESTSRTKKARLDRGGSTASTGPSQAAAERAEKAAAAENAYVVPSTVREPILVFLLRFVSLSTEPVSRGVVNKAYNLLKDLLVTPGWSEMPIKLAIFQRPLTTTEVKESNLVVITNSLQTLKLVIKDKSSSWFLAHLPQLHKLLEKNASCDEPIVLEHCRAILDRIFEVLPEPVPSEDDAEGEEDADADADGELETGDATAAAAAAANKPAKTASANGKGLNGTVSGPDEEAASFRNFVENIITEGLRNSSNLYGAFIVLGSWAKAKPDVIDTHLQALTKALTKLTKEHLGPSNQDGGLKLLLMVLDLLKARISSLGEQRRWFLSAVVQLIERSTSLDLCRYLLSTMSKWILDQDEQFPTVKEKAGILIKMMTYEAKDEQLLRDFLDLIHSIYTTPAFARTELTVRLENAFLLGCRNRDPVVRQRFIDIFDRTLVRNLSGRMQYLLGTQTWDFLADSYWIQQVLDLLMGSIEGDRPLLGAGSRPASSTKQGDPDFARIVKGLTTGNLVSSVRKLLYTSPEATRRIWSTFFGAAWRSMVRKQQEDTSKALIGVLTRDFHLRQVAKRPNVVQTLLEGALKAKPHVELPPHVVKYLGKTFDAWYTALELLQDMLGSLPREDDATREAVQDALGELLAELSEDDVFYGLWRRRCVYAESNAAISYEQSGMWGQAQIMYELAQVKARSGQSLTFTEAEYGLWEDHWVLCAQKLQQWDILTDLAKLEGNNDLLLECAWRLSDWVAERDILEQALESLSTTSTPRRRVFAAYMALLKSQSAYPSGGGAGGGGLQQQQQYQNEFARICDEAIQLTLSKWHSLPELVTQAHVPLLQIFQQFVELQEASQIFASLAVTNATNLDQRSTELKTLMQTWRERLPNLWDDINAWSDLVAWRQHVFGAVNKAYLPLVAQMQQQQQQQNGQGANSSTNSYAYRGYHETAWIINRFAHVARKHYLSEVCIGSLTKIYTLPNIEIQEAFLKLREQAKCHYQNPNELAQGLDVINNTNLMFFAAPQKAEFFTLKGMFMAKLGLSEEANRAFATAIQMDLNLAKAWTEWGRFNDRIFRDKPAEIVSASSAVSCYLQAAGLYKSAKVRKVLVRVLWLLSCDDSKGTVAGSFEGFRGEAPIWYWITYIPQLLQSLAQKEAKYARRLLMQIAKMYPQSLYFSLRTSREDYLVMKRNALMASQRLQQRQQQQQQAAQAQAQAQAQAGQSDKAGEEGNAKEEDGKKDDVGGEGKDAKATSTEEKKDEPEKKEGDVEMKDAQAETKADEKKDEAVSEKAKGDEQPAGEKPESTPAADPTPAPTTTAPATSSTPASASIPTPITAPASASTATAVANSAPTASPASSAQQQGQQQGQPQGQQQGQQQNQQQQQQRGTPSQQPMSGGQIPFMNLPPGARPAWEYVEEILNILKTAFPLLALTMENMADQIQQRFKPTNDEDIYRLTNALLNDALQQYIQRAVIANDNGQLPQLSMANVARFAENLPPGPLKSSFEEDFVSSKPTLREYVSKLQRWRDQYELVLERKPTRLHLEHCSHYLVEFQHQRFDDVEVPGQYLKLEDNNADFVKIARFLPTYDVVRSAGVCTRRLSILSSKGSVHMFSVQLPSGRYCRREERLSMLFRTLNRVLERRKETRRRGLVFTTPAMVPLGPQLRLIETNPSIVSMQDIYEQHCQDIGIGKDDPIIAWVEKLRSTLAASEGNTGMVEMSNLRMELLDEISTKMVPDTVLSDYFTRSMTSASDLWLLRKHFALQMASTMFITYIFFVSARLPSRILISRDSGQVSMTDVIPTFHPTSPTFKSPDATPFRLTPNIQHFIGPIGVEGILTSSLVAIGRVLSEPDHDLEEQLSIYVRDEVLFWIQTAQRQQQQQQQAQGGAAAAAATAAMLNPLTEAPREIVMSNISEVVKRARLMSCKHELDKSQPNTTMPVSQVVIDLINSSSSPSKLALQDVSWMPFL